MEGHLFIVFSASVLYFMEDLGLSCDGDLHICVRDSGDVHLLIQHFLVVLYFPPFLGKTKFGWLFISLNLPLEFPSFLPSSLPPSYHSYLSPSPIVIPISGSLLHIKGEAGKGEGREGEERGIVRRKGGAIFSLTTI